MSPRDSGVGELLRHFGTGAQPRSRRSRFVWLRARRIAAALLIGLASLVAMSTLGSRGDADGIPVLVAAHDLATGARVGPDDLREARLPGSAVPQALVVGRERATGAVLAAPLSEGEVVTTTRLQGSSQLTGAPVGTVAVAVPVVDPGILRTLRAGDRVRILTLGTGSLLADATVLVAESPGPQEDSMTSWAGASDSGAGRLIAAVDPPSAVALASASGPAGVSGGFFVALLGSGAQPISPASP